MHTRLSSVKPYKIIYSKRRSIQISVSDNNEVTVRCPYSMSSAYIERFLSEKQGWIKRMIRKNSARMQTDSEVLNFKAVYIDGKQAPLILGEKNLVTENCVFLKSIKDIQKLFIKSFLNGFLADVCYISEKINLIPLSVKVKNYKSRWGCCDIKGNISFNYKLFMLSPKIREYVIVHELCHLKHHNHSAAFWKLVEHYLPDCKERRKELKNFDFLTTLY